MHTAIFPEDLLDKVASTTALGLPPQLFFCPMRQTCKRIRDILTFSFLKAKDSSGRCKSRRVILLHWKSGWSCATSHVGLFFPARGQSEFPTYVFLNVRRDGLVDVHFFSGAQHVPVPAPIPVATLQSRFYLGYASNRLTLKCPLPVSFEIKLLDHLSAQKTGAYPCLEFTTKLKLCLWDSIISHIHPVVQSPKPRPGTSEESPLHV